MATLDIRNFTRSNPGARIPFEKIATAVLPAWEISLVFAGERRAQQFNIALRNKDYVPNVLSYVTSSNTKGAQRAGEIIICPAVARKQAPDYELSTPNFIAYLFIHGLLHLKGQPHGATMERHERELMTRFGFRTSTHLPSNGTTHRNRH